METIFIVDDDRGTRAALARLAEAAGWAAGTFASAAEFLSADAPRECESGCAVLDVRMPGMGGAELQRAMRDRGISLPVVFLTGYGDVATSVSAMKLGAVDFLEKPVNGRALVASLREALARHADHRARESRERAARARLAFLTPRERDVLEGVIRGRLNKQIAADLAISVKTVKHHRGHVMRKTEARSVAALVALCRNAGAGTSAPTSRGFN